MPPDRHPATKAAVPARVKRAIVGGNHRLRENAFSAAPNAKALNTSRIQTPSDIGDHHLNIGSPVWF